MNVSWDVYLAPPADFAGADDFITNLPKEREPGDIKRTPLSLIITSLINYMILISYVTHL